MYFDPVFWSLYPPLEIGQTSYSNHDFRRLRKTKSPRMKRLLPLIRDDCKENEKRPFSYNRSSKKKTYDMPSKKEVEIQNTGTSMLVISRRGRGKRFLSTIFQTASGVTSAEYVQQAGCLSAVRRAAELFISNASGLYYLQIQKKKAAGFAPTVS
jgi:hypothetical protein